MQRKYIDDPQTVVEAASNLNRAFHKLGVEMYWTLPRCVRAAIMRTAGRL